MDSDDDAPQSSHQPAKISAITTVTTSFPANHQPPNMTDTTTATSLPAMKDPEVTAYGRIAELKKQLETADAVAVKLRDQIAVLKDEVNRLHAQNKNLESELLKASGGRQSLADLAAKEQDLKTFPSIADEVRSFFDDVSEREYRGSTPLRPMHGSRLQQPAACTYLVSSFFLVVARERCVT